MQVPVIKCVRRAAYRGGIFKMPNTVFYALGTTRQAVLPDEGDGG